MHDIKYIEDEDYFLINEIIKVDKNIINKLICKKNLNNLIKNNDDLWEYKKISLIKILFDIDTFETIIFKNNDDNDYRFNNLNITYKSKYNFNKPENVEILEEYEPKLITRGHYSGQYRNMYWRVKEGDSEYYIMHINENTFTKFSLLDKEKISNLEISNTILIWYLNLNGYIGTTIKNNGEKKCIYLHQYIMNVHFEDNTDMKKTVDHFNRDKLDNRKDNLRFASMSEQNSNRDKQKRQKQACELPNGIKQTDMPKYVIYNNRCYDKENNSWREFFTIEGHIKLIRTWATSKSNNVSIKDKLEQAKLKLKNLNGEISDEDYKKLITTEEMNIPYIKLKIFRKKYHLIFDREVKISGKRCRKTLYMVLDHNDLQLMLDKFITEINNKYPELKIEAHKLENITMLDFSDVGNEITEEKYEEITIETETINEPVLVSDIQLPITNIKVNNDGKYKIKPDLPPNFSLYKEKDDFYLGFSKIINTVRYNKKHLLKCMCIQTEIDRLIDDINKTFPNIKIDKYNVMQPRDFIDKTILKISNKPIMPRNFSICNTKGVDYIQFCKKINDKKITLKTKINSYDLESEVNNYIACLNKKYDYKLEKVTVILNDWKTTNKIN